MGKKQESSKTRIKWSFPQGPVEETGRVSAGNRGAGAVLGMATTTRVRGGLAAEMKALANNLRGVWGTTQRGPVLTSCAGLVTQRGTVHLLVWGNGGWCRSSWDPASTLRSHRERGGRRRPGKEHGEMLDTQWGRLS